MSDTDLPKKYSLPYANPAVDSDLAIAEQAYWQADSAAQSCRRFIASGDPTITDIIPNSTDQSKEFTQSILFSTRSLMLTAESALQAQTSVCGALISAQKTLFQFKAERLRQTQQMAQEIAALDAHAAQLRAAFNQAADARGDETYATNAAKDLLSALETAYQKHEQNKRLHQSVNETESNLAYIGQALAEAQKTLQLHMQLAQRTKEEWRQILDMLHIDPQDPVAQSQMLAYPSAPAPAPVAPPPQEPKPEPQQPEPGVILNAANTEPVKRHSKKKPSVPEEEENTSAWAMIWSYIKVIIVAFLIAFVLRAYVFDITLVEGTSMVPRLQDGNYLITSRITYTFSDIQRGDIVVLNAPDDPGEDYIKRIIGLPGETVVIADGQVYVDGVLLVEPYLDNVQTEGEITQLIPNGYYFVMGDNRMDSRDSRYPDIGLISQDDIEGKAMFRLLPLSGFGSLY